MDNKESNNRQTIIYVLIPLATAVIVGVCSVLATTLPVIIARPTPIATITATIDPLITPSTPLSTQVAVQITSTQVPSPVIFRPGTIITLTGLGFFISILIIFFYYRKILSMVNSGSVFPTHIESYLDKRILIRLSKEANQSEGRIDAPSIQTTLEAEELLLKGITPYLKSLLSDKSKSPYQEEVVKIFIELKTYDVDIENCLTRILSNGNANSKLQIVCIDALSSVPTPTTQAVTALRSLLKNPGVWHKNVINRSIAAMTKINPPGYQEDLIRYLNNDQFTDDTKDTYIVPALRDFGTDKARAEIAKYEALKKK